MGYTAPTTRASGYLVTSADWNAELVDNITFLANPPACRVYHNTTQSFTDATEATVTFNSERFDTASMHDTVTNPSRITFPVAGIYLVTFSALFPSATDYALVYAYLRLNGTTALTQVTLTPTTFNTSPVLEMTTIYKFAANDYVEVRAYQDNTASAARNMSSTANQSPELAACWMGLG